MKLWLFLYCALAQAGGNRGVTAPPVVTAAPGSARVAAAPPAAAPSAIAAAASAPKAAAPAAPISGLDALVKTLEDPKAFVEMPEKLGGVFDKSDPGPGNLEKEYMAPKTRGAAVNLNRIDPDDTHGVKKDKAQRKLAKDRVALDERQDVLFADAKRKVLIVFQGMDTSGKDGIIRHVMSAMTPAGVHVANFKKPTAEEKSRHFLWRVVRSLKNVGGMITLFNRSHYEDIIVPSVFPEWYPDLSEKDLKKRYEQINAFEKRLADEGWVIMKFLLHISYDEQGDRLEERMTNPAKYWKLSQSDFESRKRWPAFMRALGGIVANTNTEWAPWYVIPANNKWFRDYIVAKIIKHRLKRLDLNYPPKPDWLDGAVLPR